MGGIARTDGQGDAQGIALQIRFFNMVALGKLLCVLRQLALMTQWGIDVTDGQTH